jgi:MFS family permease
VHLSSVITALISFPIWGRHADIVGNARILKITSFVIPLIPILWICAPNFIALALVEMFAGFIWGGFNLCSANFIYDAVSPQKRVRCLGYFNLITGTMVFLGASIGGYLADRLPVLWGNKLFFLFMISAFLRFCSDFFLSPHFQEVRAPLKKVSSSTLFFSVAGIRPILGENVEPEALTQIHEPAALKRA